ncbi:MAG: hypothetical protein Q8P11_01755 [bacterium]|nr:hypothetical protein [bacterium]
MLKTEKGIRSPYQSIVKNLELPAFARGDVKMADIKKIFIRGIEYSCPCGCELNFECHQTPERLVDIQKIGEHNNCTSESIFSDPENQCLSWQQVKMVFGRYSDRLVPDHTTVCLLKIGKFYFCLFALHEKGKGFLTRIIPFEQAIHQAEWNYICIVT